MMTAATAELHVNRSSERMTSNTVARRKEAMKSGHVDEDVDGEAS